MEKKYITIPVKMREGKTIFAMRMMERMRNLGFGFRDPIPDDLLYEIKKIPLILETKRRNRVKSMKTECKINV
jgi:hypothetical protein